MSAKTTMPLPEPRWHLRRVPKKKGLVCAVKYNKKARTKMEEYDEEEA